MLGMRLVCEIRIGFKNCPACRNRDSDLWDERWALCQHAPFKPNSQISRNSPRKFGSNHPPIHHDNALEAHQLELGHSLGCLARH